MTSTSTQISDTRATIPITTPKFLTQHIVGSIKSAFTPYSDCFLGAIEPNYFSQAPYLINVEQFPGFWCIPPNYLVTGDGTPWESKCYPPATKSQDGTFRHFIGPYSPGIACPTGWTSAMTIVPRISTGHDYLISNSRTLTPGDYFLAQYPSSTLLQGESGAVCCPSYVVA